MSTARQNVTVVEHPLVQHKLTLMRKRETTTVKFRQLSREVATLLAYEVTRDLPLTTTPIDTPLAEMIAPTLAGKKLCMVSILRAGDGLLQGMLDLVPSARVGHVGIYRDPESLTAVEYYFKVPEDLQERLVIVVDPMLATGNSAVAAVSTDQGGGRAADQVRLPAGGARRRRPVPERAPGRADLHRRDRPEAQRPRLHHARPGRRRRPPVRHQVSGSEAGVSGR